MLVNFHKAIEESLSELKICRRGEGIYSFLINKEVLGWIGFNRVVNRTDKVIEINPVIGVRHQTLEKLVAELIGVKFQRYIPPTLSIHLGYLMPEQKYHPWLIQIIEPIISVQISAQEMASAIKEYGLPFMLENANLQNLCKTMTETEFSFREHCYYRIPVAFFLLNDFENAKRYLNMILVKLKDRKDSAATLYRDFSSRLISRVDEKL
jgi:hypothetical protein